MSTNWGKEHRCVIDHKVKMPKDEKKDCLLWKSDDFETKSPSKKVGYDLEELENKVG